MQLLMLLEEDLLIQVGDILDKKKMEFGKKLLILDYSILFLMILLFFIFTGHEIDTSNFVIILSAWIAQIAISSGCYYWKAKAENLIKLPIYMLNNLPEDMKDKADPNQIIESVMGIDIN